MTRPRFRLWMLLALVAVIAVVLALVPTVLYLANGDWIDDAYATWGAGEMVVHYMRDHGDRWPSGWADLKPYFDAGGGRSFAQYQQRITIRCDVDPAALRAEAMANPRPTFRVIQASHFFSGSFGGRETNEILHRYLREVPRR